MAGPRLSSCRYLRSCIDEALRLTLPVPGTPWREGEFNSDDEQPWIMDRHVKVEYPPTHQPPYALLFPIQNYQNCIDLLINKNIYNDMYFLI